MQRLSTPDGTEEPARTKVLAGKVSPADEEKYRELQARLGHATMSDLVRDALEWFLKTANIFRPPSS
jgi:hypothetical protein